MYPIEDNLDSSLSMNNLRMKGLTPLLDLSRKSKQFDIQHLKIAHERR